MPTVPLGQVIHLKALNEKVSNSRLHNLLHECQVGYQPLTLQVAHIQ